MPAYAKSHFALPIFLAATLTACGWTDVLVGPSVEPSVDAACRQQAHTYVNENHIEPIWRNHEFSRQYEACVERRSG